MKRLGYAIKVGAMFAWSSKQVKIFLAVFICTVGGSSHVQAWHPERWFDPSDPRPDFLPHTVTNAWVPYRKVYNRPTYVGGHIAAIVEPTSQEAMAWKIHKDNGDYRYHRPGTIPMYLYPKPWEVLPVGSRTQTGEER